jgi:hypothetical protein
MKDRQYSVTVRREKRGLRINPLNRVVVGGVAYEVVLTDVNGRDLMNPEYRAMRRMAKSMLRKYNNLGVDELNLDLNVNSRR